MERKEMLEKGRKVIEMERYELKRLMDSLDDSFIKGVELITDCRGKIILTGTGKSGLIGRKIAATLCCTGKPAFFLSAYNCENGDIGAIQPNDLIIAISNSGETEILKNLVVPSAKTIGAKAMCLTGNLESTLAKQCDVAIYIGVEKEACPTGVNATTSTTNTLAMGDALAMVSEEIRGVTREQVLFYHQGGAWGEKLKEEFEK